MEYGHVTCAKGRSLNELNYRVGIAVKKMNELKKGDHVKKKLKKLLESKKLRAAGDRKVEGAAGVQKS